MTEGITVAAASGPMELEWGEVADYYRIVDGWRERVPRRRWWQRRRT